MLVRYLRDHAIVVDHAALGQHEAVANASRLQRRDRMIGVVVDQRARVGADHLDLAQRRGIEDAHRLARSQRLARNLVLGLAGTEPGRPQPAAIFAEHRAGLAVLVFEREAAHRIEQLPAPAPGDHRQRHGDEGRPVGGRARLGDGPAGDGSHRGKAVHVRGLALVGCHAERGVALQMLDGAEVLACCQLDILERYVVLEVDPLASRSARNRQCRFDRVRFFRVGRRGWRVCPATCRVAVGKRAGQAERSVRRADDDHARTECGWNECCDLVVIAQLAAGLAMEMDGRRVAAGDEQAIAFEPLATDVHCLDAIAAVHGIDGCVCEARDCVCRCRRCRARVGHRHLCSGRPQRLSDEIGSVVVGGEHDPAADQHAM